MATNTCVVPGIISDVRKVPYLFPVVRRNLVAAIASSLMLFGGVRESRVVDCRGTINLPRRRWSPSPLFLACCADADETDRTKEENTCREDSNCSLDDTTHYLFGDAFSVLPLCSLCLCGEPVRKEHSPRRHREHRGSIAAIETVGWLSLIWPTTRKPAAASRPPRT